MFVCGLNADDSGFRLMSCVIVLCADMRVCNSVCVCVIVLCVHICVCLCMRECVIVRV